MKKWLVATTLFALGFLIMPVLSGVFGVPEMSLGKQVHAQFDDPTCKFGVHMISASDEDYVKAAELINANGGDYCWMTVVFREDEMTVEHLQRIHNLAREHRFNIIHRIEKGFDSSGKWYMPDTETTQKFIDVIEQIIPASMDVYVVLGNEPTHALMCGGCTPESYAKWAAQSTDMLHDADFNAVVMLAGQDLHSPQAPPDYYDAGIFMRGMFAAEPQLLCEIDAWASHSYPQSFVGNPLGLGRQSPRGYLWELALLEELASPECLENVKNLPVLITETGYKVGAQGIADAQAYSHTQQMLRLYNEDARVRGVTFFAYTFCGEPFESFALAHCNDRLLNGSGKALYESAKSAGKPRHIHLAQTTVECPPEMVIGSEIMCTVTSKNLGTDIWHNIGGDYSLSLIGYVRGGAQGPRYSFTGFRTVRPGESLTTYLTYNPGTVIGQHDLNIGITRGGKVTQSLATVSLPAFDMPELTVSTENIFGDKITASQAQAELQIFNEDEKIIFRRKVDIADGVGAVGKVSGVVFNTCYRAVLLVEGSLPVQKPCLTFSNGINAVEMPRLFPVDSNNDGKLSLGDFLGRSFYNSTN